MSYETINEALVNAQAAVRDSKISGEIKSNLVGAIIEAEELEVTHDEKETNQSQIKLLIPALYQCLRNIQRTEEQETTQFPVDDIDSDAEATPPPRPKPK